MKYFKRKKIGKEQEHTAHKGRNTNGFQAHERTCSISKIQVETKDTNFGLSNQQKKKKFNNIQD